MIERSTYSHSDVADPGPAALRWTAPDPVPYSEHTFARTGRARGEPARDHADGADVDPVGR